MFYSEVIHDAAKKKEHLEIAEKDFKDSIQAHKELKSLSSREEFNVFVRAVHKLGITYRLTGRIKEASDLNAASRLLFQHYCTCTGTIPLDKEITNVISFCLRVLHLKQFCDEEDYHARKPLINTGGSLDKSNTKGKGGTKTPYSSPLETSDLLGIQPSNVFCLADHENISKLHLGGYTASVKLKKVPNRIPVPSLDNNSTDMDALTVYQNSDTRNCVSGSVSGTVIRCNVTQDLKQDTASLPNERFLTPEAPTTQSQSYERKEGASPGRVQGIELRVIFTN